LPARGFESQDFRVFQFIVNVEAFADFAVRSHKNCADHRIGARKPFATPGERKRAVHPSRIRLFLFHANGGGHGRLSQRGN
jgi:hypothetical protein